MSRMRHGTYTMYVGGNCRCFDCTVALTEHIKTNRRRKGGWAVQDTATRGEVREWAAGLGFTIAASMVGKKADALISRYNREHPDRPYLRPSDTEAMV